MPVLPRRIITGLSPVYHGGLKYEELENGSEADQILDFSVNVNPFPPVPGVRELISRSRIERYPDCRAGGLRAALGSRHSLGPENVLVTHGVTEAIRLIPLAYLEPGDSVLISAPTYGEYESSCELMGAAVIRAVSAVERGFRPDIEGLPALIRRHSPKIVWVCNPNNPTGVYLTEDEIEELRKACVGVGALLVIDEAYVNFLHSPLNSATPEPSSRIDGGNCIIMHSMTKDYAVPGLRLGYVLADRVVIESLEKVKPPWNIGAPAQAAGLEILSNLEYYHGTWQQLSRLTEDFRAGLRAIGLEVLSTRTNFFLVRLEKKEQVLRQLKRRRILLRDCSSFGLPDYVRVGTKLETQNLQLVESLKEVL